MSFSYCFSGFNFNGRSKLRTLHKHQYFDVVVPDFGILSIKIIEFHAGETWGAAKVMKLYGSTWLLATHWYVGVQLSMWIGAEKGSSLIMLIYRHQCPALL